jgi:hypothetical protein
MHESQNRNIRISLPVHTGKGVRNGNDYATTVPTAVLHHVYMLCYSHSRLITTIDELFTRKATFILSVSPQRTSYHSSSWDLRRRRLVFDGMPRLFNLSPPTSQSTGSSLPAEYPRDRGVERWNLCLSGIGPHRTR